MLPSPDLVVIGSGIVGLNAALKAKKLHPDWKILVLESGTLPSGASTKNAGFACFGSPSEVLMDIKTSSEQVVFETISARTEGLKILKEHLGEASKIG